MIIKHDILSTRRGARGKPDRQQFRPLCTTCRIGARNGTRTISYISLHLSRRRPHPRIGSFVKFCSLFYILSHMTVGLRQTMPSLSSRTTADLSSSFSMITSYTRDGDNIASTLQFIRGVTPIGRNRAPRRKIIMKLNDIYLNSMGLEAVSNSDLHLNENSALKEAGSTLYRYNSIKALDDELQESHENIDDQDGYQSEQDQNREKRSHGLIYVSCAIVIALFFRSEMFNLFCRNCESASSRRPQSIECNRLNTDESSPLLEQLDTCKWCKQMKRTEPMPIKNFKDNSLEESYNTNMAHYDLLTWKMYHRIVDSRRGRDYLTTKSVICGSCGSKIISDEALLDEDMHSEMSRDTREVDDQIFAFSFDP
eukprot:CCRYP_000086-RB/>CCRYP_000086-RB protein AED:0.38 eAED:0.38 QI:155/1/1/1/0/0.66/3/129/367